MAEMYVGGDVGGFGRLANIEMQKRREERLDKESGLRQKLSQIQIEQAGYNLEKIAKERKIESDLTALNQSLPKGETPFTATYKYLMENGEMDKANDLLTTQSNTIDRIYKKDESAGSKLFNNTIGTVLGVQISPILGTKDLIEAKDRDGKKTYLKLTPDGFERVETPPDLNIEGKKKKGVELKDKNLQVINEIAPMIKDGTATPAEKRLYQLAEADYTKAKRFSDPITGQIYTEKPSLPKGFPTLKGKGVEGAPSKAVKDDAMLTSEEDMSPQEIDTAVGGIVFEPVFDPARLDKKEIQNYRKTVDSTNLMLNGLKELLDDIKNNGTRTADLNTIARRDSQYHQVLMRYKEILNLGVLNGPDMEIMEKILKKPTSAGALTLGKGYVVPGYESVINQLETQLRDIEQKTGGIVKGLKMSEQDKMDFLDTRGAELFQQGMTKDEAFNQAVKEMEAI